MTDESGKVTNQKQGRRVTEQSYVKYGLKAGRLNKTEKEKKES
jgi:hypothetical protein